MQRAEDFLFEDGFDAIPLGEGEETFTEFLDCATRKALMLTYMRGIYTNNVSD